VAYPEQVSWSNPRLTLPAYRFADAARLAQTSAPTIARWYRGYAVPGHRMEPVLPSDGTTLLSYLQLVEVAFVATFRRRGVDLDGLREAHRYLREMFGTEYPFALGRLKTDGVHVLADFDGRLVAADKGGQVFWSEAVGERADQFDYEHGVALRWHPRGRGSLILVDPRIAFGAPIVESAGVPTSALRQRYRGGDSAEYLAEDYGIPLEAVDEALEIEGTARLAA
jgi:uncharacterized protein (DUF433 family)